MRQKLYSHSMEDPVNNWDGLFRKAVGPSLFPAGSRFLSSGSISNCRTTQVALNLNMRNWGESCRDHSLAAPKSWPSLQPAGPVPQAPITKRTRHLPRGEGTKGHPPSLASSAKKSGENMELANNDSVVPMWHSLKTICRGLSPC